LERRQFHSDEEVEMAVREWLRLQESTCYGNGVVTRAKVGKKCVNVFGDYFKK
jgi:hypothetical protein